MAHKILFGSDLYKGFKLPANKLLGGAIDDILPFQMLTLEEKTADWIKMVADYYETAGWHNVEKKAGRIQRNYWMRYGKLNPSDYIVNPTHNQYYQAVGWVLPPENHSPLEQFYPLAPNFVDVLRGEFIKRDNTWTIETIDEMSKAETFRNKENDFESILMQQAMMERQMTLSSMGIGEDVDPEQYAQQMEALQKQMTEVEFKSRNFRTTGAKWAEKVLKIHDRRYNLHELEPDAFESGLICDREFWHLDLLDDDFKLELLNPKWCDYHKGPNVKYVSEGDYFLWFDFMSAGDIVNKFGKRMKEEDILKMRDIYVKTANIIVPDYLKNHQGSYYDLSKNWLQATDLDPKMNDALLGKELAYNYMRSPNFDHNMEVDILNPIWGRRVTGHPQMFRVMRLYWRSMKRIGWLTKKLRDGTTIPPDWVDENYRVTVDPVYDKSIKKEETADNLIYGEHVDWTWVGEWRHLLKISPNQKHTFWLNSHNALESIYIDGAPVRFQFQGRSNVYDALPPVEGCEFSYVNTDANSFIDRICPLQIIYNICMNKVPKKFLKDYGRKVAIDKRTVPQNNTSRMMLGNDGKEYEVRTDPMDDYEDQLLNSDFLPYMLSRDAMEGMGQPALPQVLELSTVDEAQLYFQLGQMIKWEAGELVGITRQRLGKNQSSETATGINQAIAYSEAQTEKYFEQHSNLMQRVRQRMLDAAQYYSTFQEKSRDIYMNEMDENVMLDIEGMENLFPHYNINLQSRANVRAVLRQITDFLLQENTMDIKPSSKIGAIAAQSLPHMMELIRRGEAEQAIAEERQRQFEQEQMAAQQQASQQLEETRLAFEADQSERDRQSQENIAKIRALGGLQSDNDMDGQIDAAQNLDALFKQQDMLNKYSAASEDRQMQKDSNQQQLIADQAKAQAEMDKEIIKGEYALKVAEENKNAAELKARQAKKKAAKKKK